TLLMVSGSAICKQLIVGGPASGKAVLRRKGCCSCSTSIRTEWKRLTYLNARHLWDFISDALYSPQVQSRARRAFGGTEVEVRQSCATLTAAFYPTKPSDISFTSRTVWSGALTSGRMLYSGISPKFFPTGSTACRIRRESST